MRLGRHCTSQPAQCNASSATSAQSTRECIIFFNDICFTFTVLTLPPGGEAACVLCLHKSCAAGKVAGQASQDLATIKTASTAVHSPAAGRLTSPTPHSLGSICMHSGSIKEYVTCIFVIGGLRFRQPSKCHSLLDQDLSTQALHNSSLAAHSSRCIHAVLPAHAQEPGRPGMRLLRKRVVS